MIIYLQQLPVPDIPLLLVVSVGDPADVAALPEVDVPGELLAV